MDVEMEEFSFNGPHAGRRYGAGGGPRRRALLVAAAAVAVALVAAAAAAGGAAFGSTMLARCDEPSTAADEQSLPSCGTAASDAAQAPPPPPPPDGDVPVPVPMPGPGPGPDLCPDDPVKSAPGQCGCGAVDADADGDRVADCVDRCPDDPHKVGPGMCGCGEEEADTDGDGVPDCVDECMLNPNKVFGGVCGCAEERDTDGDGVPDCIDRCPIDITKTAPGVCGCGVPDGDRDGDGVFDCLDLCDRDPLKTTPGECGCGEEETPDCKHHDVCEQEEPEFDDFTPTKVREWLDAVREVAAADHAPSRDSGTMDEALWRSCWQDSDWFRMNGDPLCSMLWMRKLAYGVPTSFDSVLAVVTGAEQDGGAYVEKRGQTGGIEVTLDTGVKGYFKMCFRNTDSRESFLTEISTFLVDRFLGFYRTPVVVPYYMDREELLLLAQQLVERDNSTYVNEEDNPVYNVNTILEHCGTPDGNGVEGAMVGWINFPLRKISRHSEPEYVVDYTQLDHDAVRDLYRGDFHLTSNSSETQIRHMVESTALNIFCFATGYLDRFDHNVFVVQSHDALHDGPCAYIDNDRARYDRVVTEHFEEEAHAFKTALATFCSVPQELGERILYFTNHASHVTLGDMMSEAVALLPSGGVLQSGYVWSDSYSSNIDENVKFLGKLVRYCIEHHGRAGALLREPWWSGYEAHQTIVRSLVGE